MKIRAIITGATGMIGEGVLDECLKNENVEKILVIGRRPCGYVHSKLTEVIQADFSDFSPLRNIVRGYNACYFCLGVTSVGKKEEEYTAFTYTLTLNFAKILSEFNPDMTFCYISGAGTDSSEKGKTMWARVKGKTENDLMKLPFKAVYNIRPGGVQTHLKLKPTQTYYKTYKLVSWIFPVMKLIAPDWVSTVKDISLAMINSTLSGYSSSTLEVKDIKALAGRK